MQPVRAKKSLGQHFLADESVARQIASALTLHRGYRTVLEVGPGTGALTRFLAGRKDLELFLVEIDPESIAFLHRHYPLMKDRILTADFLQLDLAGLFKNPFGLIGNFPYYISTQILFKVLHHRQLIPEVVGMFQKEVAERVASPPGSRRYGLLSVLLQAFYDIEYLFTVSHKAFVPSPRVMSGVLRLRRNDVTELGCDEKLFTRLVKAAFNQRRKMLRNALREFLPSSFPGSEVLTRRAETLSWKDFVFLTRVAEAHRAVPGPVHK